MIIFESCERVDLNEYFDWNKYPESEKHLVLKMQDFANYSI